MDLGSVDIVLVRPARAANVAAACRAMKNMGLRHLKLVESEADLASGEARNLAYGAWDVLDAAEGHSDLMAAVGGSTLVVATSGRADAESWSPRRLASDAESWSRGGRTSVVFGPEASGLRNDELALCHRRVHIPSDPAHPSLNLAQAVLLIAYELRLGAPQPAPAPGAPLAPASEVEEAIEELREALLGIGYLQAQNPDAVLGELRQMVVRARPSPREVTLLRGMARQVRWAASLVARRSEPSG
jgi:TrmH family RNA methyltransferase